VYHSGHRLTGVLTAIAVSINTQQLAYIFTTQETLSDTQNYSQNTYNIYPQLLIQLIIITRSQ